MTNYTVRDLMVPISEYATVKIGATLFEAVLALEKAQLDFDHTKYLHRGVLILNRKKQVVGKLSQLDVLKALEPINEELDEFSDVEQFGFSTEFIRKLRQQKQALDVPLVELCALAANAGVESFMQAPAEGEFVDENVTLEVAVYQLLAGHHLSLLVTRKEQIIGILRLSDVFAAVFHAMKECQKNIK